MFEVICHSYDVDLTNNMGLRKLVAVDAVCSPGETNGGHLGTTQERRDEDGTFLSI